MSHPVLVCIWYDTEDYLTPSSDDSALRLAQLHSRLGVPCTFKVVGEVARRWRERGRGDVVAAVAAHHLGYHTDLHSVHPTVAEYCAPGSWDDGVALFEHYERRGFDAVREVVGREVTTYGQAGSSWAPMAQHCTREWGVPTYADEGPWVGHDGAPFWYLGQLHITRMAPNHVRFDLRATDGAEAGMRRFDEACERLSSTGGVINIGFHPNEWNTNEFWDAVNFSRGANPPPERWRPASECSPDECDRRFAATERYFAHIARSGAVPVGCGDIVGRYLAPGRALRAVTAAELVAATAGWTDSVGYANVTGTWLSAAEVLSVAASLLCGQPAAAPLASEGPRDDLPPLAAPRAVTVGELRQAAQLVLDRVSARTASGWSVAPLPSGVPVGPALVRPEEFLDAALAALRAKSERGAWPAEVELRPVGFAPAQHVVAGPGYFNWVIHPEGFDAPKLLDHARRQAWTFKPVTWLV